MDPNKVFLNSTAPTISDADVINYESQIGVPKGLRYVDMENMSEKDYNAANQKRLKYTVKQISPTPKYSEDQKTKKDQKPLKFNQLLGAKISKLSSDQKKKMDQISKESLKTSDPMQTLLDSLVADPLDTKNRKDPNAESGGSAKFFTDSDGKVRKMSGSDSPTSTDKPTKPYNIVTPITALGMRG